MRKLYFGELTKHLCLQLLCYVFQVLARTVGRRRRDLYTLIDVLGSWEFYELYFDITLGIIMLCLNENTLF